VKLRQHIENKKNYLESSEMVTEEIIL